VRLATHIVVIGDGKILEAGTHAALLALGGRYAEMFTLQAARFVPEGMERGASA
jgi:ATP-binding cassette, subfamily B, bacterial